MSHLSGVPRHCYALQPNTKAGNVKNRKLNVKILQTFLLSLRIANQCQEVSKIKSLLKMQTGKFEDTSASSLCNPNGN